MKAIRGATTIRQDSPEEIRAAVKELLCALSEKNGLSEQEMICILFSNTADIRSLYPAKAAREEDIYFEKSAYGSDALYEYLKTAGYDEIELCGVVSNICVISNAVLAKTALPEADITVDALCTASNDEKLNSAALDVLESLNVQIKNREKI